ncbi:MAG: DUF4147 domain-containing protein [Planctomycetaceae bacterium]|nr:MAG: DUF4147 domain-containing protein [Planctomycetaceae bacterium]
MSGADAAEAVAIWQAGVDAVRGDSVVASRVSVDPQRLSIDQLSYARDAFDSVLVVGAGKATAAMAAGWLRAVGDAFPVRGRINVPRGSAAGFELGPIDVCEAREPGENEPTELAVRGTEATLSDVAATTERDLVVVLLSGGGSALWVAPIEGITWQDKWSVARQLSAAGASIGELNAVRKRLSRIKGGGLRRACRRAPMVTLVLSDVIGDPLDTIASGPTVVDTQPPEFAQAVLSRYDAEGRLPESVRRAIASPPIPADWPDHLDNRIVVIGNNETAVAASAVRAAALGHEVKTESAVDDEGMAEEVGRRLAEAAIRGLHDRQASERPRTMISGGEPVVKLVDAAKRGRGGRNQQLVLAAIVQLASDPRFRIEDRERLVLLSGGTDGEDGPTDAAGAVLDRSVWEATDRLRLDPADYLHRNDAYTFFAATNGLLKTGPTGTNVCDLRVLTLR